MADNGSGRDVRTCEHQWGYRDAVRPWFGLGPTKYQFHCKLCGSTKTVEDMLAFELWSKQVCAFLQHSCNRLVAESKTLLDTYTNLLAERDRMAGELLDLKRREENAGPKQLAEALAENAKLADEVGRRGEAIKTLEEVNADLRGMYEQCEHEVTALEAEVAVLKDANSNLAKKVAESGRIERETRALQAWRQETCHAIDGLVTARANATARLISMTGSDRQTFTTIPITEEHRAAATESERDATKAVQSP
jgi:hypothetical protein